ncbi:hypothetical protein ACG04R_00920 [Roseateles sp. BYS78W]|uniref:Uncharacterized protein n=1 Tax=Pelomonas candidula TaxID=3299025 RepID=A0ABW7H6A0_9BURK
MAADRTNGGLPLTFAAYVAPMAAALVRREFAPAMRVQVRKHGAVFCGRVLEGAPANAQRDVDLFKVDCCLGQLWFSAKNVRQCSGLDGRCGCDEGPGEARACAGAPGASAVPPGNTGTTVVEGA